MRIVFGFMLFSVYAFATPLVVVKTDSRTLTFPFSNDKVKVDLDLAEKVESIQVQNNREEIEVTQTGVTSVTVMNEGPHYDLLEWKHGYTETMTLNNNMGIFKVAADQEGELPFPTVDNKEILKELKRMKVPANYLELAKTCKDPRTYPCGVGISSTEFLVSEKKNKKSTKKIVVNRPMGC
jgi:hypothetical protein